MHHPPMESMGRERGFIKVLDLEETCAIPLSIRACLFSFFFDNLKLDSVYVFK